jgi:anti-sigma regulatory factor (Ser/Thr protein kinase)
MGYLQSQFNNLTFHGEFGGDDLRRLLAALHNLRKQSYEAVNLDFRSLTKAYTPHLLPLAVTCRKFLHEGFEVRLELPSERKLERLFVNSNWAHLIDPQGFEKVEYEQAQHLPALLYSTPEDQHSAVDRALELILRNLNIRDRKQIQAIEWSVNEVADNVLNHSNSPIGGAIQVSARQTKNTVEFVVSDGGVGVPKTLRESHRHYTSDVEALDKAIREGVTRNNATNQGNGLFGSFRLAELSKGEFNIYSGSASLSYSERRGLHSKQESIPFPGATVTCSINISNPDLLSEALTFKGVSHTPYSIIDKVDEESSTSIDLAKEAKSFGSRLAAKPVRIKIENLIENTSTRIVIDLTNVALISSSFADEVFGKLFVGMGPLSFMNRVSLVGGSRIVNQLIERAIAQRMTIGTIVD